MALRADTEIPISGDVHVLYSLKVHEHETQIKSVFYTLLDAQAQGVNIVDRGNKIRFFSERIFGC